MYIHILRVYRISTVIKNDLKLKILISNSEKPKFSTTEYSLNTFTLSFIHAKK